VPKFRPLPPFVIWSSMACRRRGAWWLLDPAFGFVFAGRRDALGADPQQDVDARPRAPPTTGHRRQPAPESAQAGADVFHSPVEPQRVARSGNESVMGVKLRRFIVDSVHYDEPGRGCLAGGNSLAERFGKQ
jgi:hypothetical protein